MFHTSCRVSAVAAAPNMAAPSVHESKLLENSKTFDAAINSKNFSQLPQLLAKDVTLHHGAYLACRYPPHMQHDVQPNVCTFTRMPCLNWISSAETQLTQTSFCSQTASLGVRTSLAPMRCAPHFRLKSSTNML